MLLDKIGWDEIRALYEKARDNLWCPKHCKSWRRHEKTGWYFMWSAYHFASVVDEHPIDHLTFARILIMLAHELDYKKIDYARYHKYMLPTVKEYEKAMACS